MSDTIKKDFRINHNCDMEMVGLSGYTKSSYNANGEFDNVHSYREADAKLKEWMWSMLNMVAENPEMFQRMYKSRNT